MKDECEIKYNIHIHTTLLTLSMDLSFIGESKIDPKEVLLSLRLDLEVGDVTSSLGMSGVRKHVTIRNSCREIFAC